MNVRWAIPGRLALFRKPASREEMQAVVESGVGLVVRLFDPTPRNDDERSVDWSQVDLPKGAVSIEAVDFDAPNLSSSELESIARRAHDAWKDGFAVGIHCGHGRGRTGTMALLLMAEVIRQAGSWPEIPVQLDLIKRYLEDQSRARWG